MTSFDFKEFYNIYNILDISILYRFISKIIYKSKLFNIYIKLFDVILRILCKNR